MKQQYDKQEIAQLLSKFMAGETSVTEEEVLAQYFRTHEVDKDWAEYKEMFALFDNGEVDIDLENETNSQRPISNSQKPKSVPQAVKEKPKIVTLRWLMAGIAASIALLLVFYLGRSTAEQPTLVAEKNVVTKDSVQPKHEAITPIGRIEDAVVAQAAPAKPQTTKHPAPKTANSESASAAESLADCIARLEAEMNDLDDSVNSAQVERLIAADFRLTATNGQSHSRQTDGAGNEQNIKRQYR